MGTKHKEAMNQQLLRDVQTQTGAGGVYAGITGFETIDRVIASDSEEDANGGAGSAYYDIFGLDRDSATTFDANVSHNSGTDRALSDSLIRTMIYDIKEDGGNTTVINTTSVTNKFFIIPNYYNRYKSTLQDLVTHNHRLREQNYLLYLFY